MIAAVAEHGHTQMQVWPRFESKRLTEVAPGSLIIFEFKGAKYLAVSLEARNNDIPLLCLSPSHPDLDGVGVVNASAIGGSGKHVIVIPGARVVVEAPLESLRPAGSMMPVGSLLILGESLAVAAYVDTGHKGAFDIENGRDLGQAPITKYFDEWSIEVSEGHRSLKIATIKSRDPK